MKLDKPMNRKAPGVKPEDVYPEVEKILHDLTWKFVRTYYRPEEYDQAFEEVSATAHWAFMRACWKFTPGGKAKFSTWCHFVVNNKLKNLGKEIYAIRSTECAELNEEIAGFAPATASSLEMILDDVTGDLSEDARTFLQLLVETPAQLVSKATTEPKQLLKKVKEFLEWQWDSRERVNNALEEIMDRFAEAGVA